MSTFQLSNGPYTSSEEMKESSIDENKGSLSKNELKEIIALDQKIFREEKLLKVRNYESKEKSWKEKCPNGKLFVSNLPQSQERETLIRQLKKMFQPFGKLLEVEVKQKQGYPSYAFVRFEDSQCSERALQFLKGTLIFGKKISIYHSNNPKYPEKQYRKQMQSRREKQLSKEKPHHEEPERKQKQKEVKIQEDLLLKKSADEMAKIEEAIVQKHPNKRKVRAKDKKFQ